MIKEMLIANSYSKGIVNTGLIKQMYKDLYCMDISDDEAMQVAVAMNDLGVTPENFYNPKPCSNSEGFIHILDESAAANAA